MPLPRWPAYDMQAGTVFLNGGRKRGTSRMLSSLAENEGQLCEGGDI